MDHLAWKHYQLSSERKTPWYGVEKGRRRQGPAAEQPRVGNLHARFRSSVSQGHNYSGGHPGTEIVRVLLAPVG